MMMKRQLQDSHLAQLPLTWWLQVSTHAAHRLQEAPTAKPRGALLREGRLLLPSYATLLGLPLGHHPPNGLLHHLTPLCPLPRRLGASQGQPEKVDW